MRLYQIRIEIYEEATGYEIPIVVHHFNGRSKREAQGYHDAHRMSDSFLRQCEDDACFARRVACKAVRREGWVNY